MNFLDVTIILHPSGIIETDIFYKDTNNHDYLNYNSHHPKHVRDNIPFNLAKRIIVFTTNPITEQRRLDELREWLLSCDYPLPIIKKAFHNAKLQGPAPQPKSVNTIPFVTTYASNIDSSKTVQLCKTMLNDTQDNRTKRIFENSNIVLSLHQPPNLLMQNLLPLKTKYQKECLTAKINAA